MNKGGCFFLVAVYLFVHFFNVKALLNYHALCPVAQSCILCDPMNCSPSGSSVHGIFQARIMERVAISFSQIMIETLKRHLLFGRWGGSMNSQDGVQFYFGTF